MCLDMAKEQSRETGDMWTRATRMTTTRPRTRALAALWLLSVSRKRAPFPPGELLYFTATYSSGPHPWPGERLTQVSVAALARKREGVGLMLSKYMQKVWEITQDSDLHLLVNFMLDCLPITSHRNRFANDLSEARVLKKMLVFCLLVTFSDSASHKSSHWPTSCFFSSQEQNGFNFVKIHYAFMASSSGPIE